MAEEICTPGGKRYAAKMAEKFGLNAKEQEALARLWSSKCDAKWRANTTSGLKAWIAAEG